MSFLLYLCMCVVLLVTESYRFGQFKAHLVRHAMFSTPPNKLDYNEDLYSVLEVPATVGSKELKQAYYRIVFKYHPDNKQGQNEKDLCNQQMMVINAAYKVLRDAESRAKYDRKRRASVANSNAQTRTSHDTVPSTTTVHSGALDGSDVFDTQEGEPVESLVDIISELVRDLAVNKGSSIWQDAMEILERMDTEALKSSSSPAPSTGNLSEATSSGATLPKDVMNDLLVSLRVEQALLLVLSYMQQRSNSPQLAKQIYDCERTMRQLQVEIGALNASTARSSNPQPADQGMVSHTSLVDSELQKLKNEMKMRNNI